MKKTTVKKLLTLLAPYRLHAVLLLLLSAGVVFFTLYVPILIGNAIDCIVAAGRVDFAGIVPILLKTLVCIGISAVLQWLSGTLCNFITFRAVKDLRVAAFSKLSCLPMSFFDSRQSGDTLSRIISDADVLADGLLMGFTQLFSGVLTILGTLGFMFSLNVWIALAVVVITPLSLFIARFIGNSTGKFFKAQSLARAEQTALIDEMVGNQKLVKAFSVEERLLSRFDKTNNTLTDAALKATFFSSLVNPTTRFVNSVVYAAVGALGAMTVINGGLTVGALSCFLGYANQYTKPFNEISGVVTELQNALTCAERIFELMEEKPRTEDGRETLEDAKGEVNLLDVSFSYTQERPLIKDLTLDVKPGQRIAIVGPTGCGKTTVINLLMRFYDVQGGSITFDGTDTRSLTRHSLRSSVGMVLQETWLQSGTVRDNIKMGKPDATEEEVVAAAKAAHAHSFIKRLPQGYDTVLSEDGGQLSAGQKQLLCIARVMLCLPPILILDEATSSIDTRTEQRISRAFKEMMRGRTSFIVAHRLSTVRDADCILVMRDGRVIEMGTHNELMAEDGFYRALYSSQFEN